MVDISAPGRRAPMRAIGRRLDGSLDGVREFGRFLGTFSLPALYGAVVTVLIRGKYRKMVPALVSDVVNGVGAYIVGVGLLLVVAALSVFAGLQVGMQGFTGLQQIGAEQFTGLAASFASVREITPVIAGAAIAAQMGTAYTAEIGAMRVSDEIDAIEVMGVAPITYLISTRIVATFIAILPMYLLSLWVSFFATRLITVQFFGLSAGVYEYYFNLVLPPIDILYSVIKVLVFTLMVVLIHAYYGFYVHGGPAAVGIAVGRAVRASIMALVVVNLLLSFIFWGNGSSITIAG